MLAADTRGMLPVYKMSGRLEMLTTISFGNATDAR